MNDVAATLLYPFSKGILSLPATGQTVIFMNARYSGALEGLRSSKLFLQQHFKPFAEVLAAHGHASTALDAALPREACVALALLPKNDLEVRALAAQGIGLLREGGLFVCAAENKAGGTRLAGMLAAFGLQDVGQISKNKCRVAWGRRINVDESVIQAALQQGQAAPHPAHAMISMPGLFSWNRIDRGSQILLQHFPQEMSGAGADFGCGYGLLSRHVLQHNPAVKRFYCVDADARALLVSEKNLQPFSHQADIEFLWEDLTKPLAQPKNLDFIVMNPPFHAGRTADPAIGAGFIRSAAQALKKGGTLWMVANAGLPYETTLHSLFSDCAKLLDTSGFKVFRASK